MCPICDMERLYLYITLDFAGYINNKKVNLDLKGYFEIKGLLLQLLITYLDEISEGDKRTIWYSLKMFEKNPNQTILNYIKYKGYKDIRSYLQDYVTTDKIRNDYELSKDDKPKCKCSK